MPVPKMKTSSSRKEAQPGEFDHFFILFFLLKSCFFHVAKLYFDSFHFFFCYFYFIIYNFKKIFYFILFKRLSFNHNQTFISSFEYFSKELKFFQFLCCLLLILIVIESNL